MNSDSSIARDQQRDFDRLAEIANILSKMPTAHYGSSGNLGGIKTCLYAESRTIRLRIARRKGRHTRQDFKQIITRQNGCCAQCSEQAPLTEDHIIPISKGGSDAAENIQGLCGSCNSKKGARYA